MSKDIKHEYNGRVLIKAFRKQGAAVRHGKGDHEVVTYRNSSQVIPARPLGKGLQCKIIKWAVSVGLVGLLLAILPILTN